MFFQEKRIESVDDLIDGVRTMILKLESAAENHNQSAAQIDTEIQSMTARKITAESESARASAIAARLTNLIS